MDQRGFAMISIIASVLFLVFLSVGAILLLPRYTSLPGTVTETDGSTNITDPIETANSVATQADLKSIQVALEVYFAENGTYPNSLQELTSGGYANPNLDLTAYSYQFCDSAGTKVILYSNESSVQGMIIDQGMTQNVAGQPSCS